MSKAIAQSKEMKNKVLIEAAMNDGFEDIRGELTSTDYCNLHDLYRIKKELRDTQTVLNGDVDEMAKFGTSTTNHYLPLTVDYFISLARRIGKSYGPNGANTYINRNDNKVTKDGISILLQQAHDVTVFQKFLNLAVEQSKITLKKSGDGTTTAIITLAHVLEEIYNDKALRELAIGDTSMFGNALQVISKTFEKHIKKFVKPIDTLADIMNVVKVSLNYDDNAFALVNTLFEYCDEHKVNWKEAIFQVSGSSKAYSYVDMEHGISTYSQPVAKGESIEGEKKDEKAQVLVISQNISSQLDIKIITHMIMGMASQAHHYQSQGLKLTPLYIVVPKVETAASAAIFALLNKYNSDGLDVPVYIYELTPLNTDQTNDIFRDFLTYFGQRQVTLWDLCDGKDKNKPIDETENPLESLSATKVANVAREATVIRTTRKTTFIPNSPDLEAVKGTIEELKVKLDYADNPEQALGLQSRIKVLEGSKCLTLRVHHDVIPEAKRLLDQLEDAILAMNSAIQNGIVLGANFTTYKVLSSSAFCSEVMDNLATADIMDSYTANCLVWAFTAGVTRTIFEIYKNDKFILESCEKKAFDLLLMEWATEGDKVYDIRKRVMSDTIVNPVDTDVAIFTATTTLVTMLTGINQIVHENIVDAQDYIRATTNYIKSEENKVDHELVSLLGTSLEWYDETPYEDEAVKPVGFSLRNMFKDWF